MRLIVDQARVEPNLLQEEDGAAPKMRLGELLVAASKLKAEQISAVLRYQNEKRLSFGEAALKLRLVNATDLASALAQQYDYPYIAKGAPDGPSREVAVAYEPFAAPAEEFRNLRTLLLARWFGDAPAERVLAVVSPLRNEGRTYLCANLAVALAQSGKRVLLIDADLRAPRLHQMFNVRASDGLSSLLAGRSAGEPVQMPALGKLALLPAGATPPNPQELLLRLSFEEALARYAVQYDCVLLDTSSAQSGADALAVASRARALLMLVHQHRTRLSAAQRLAQQLAQLQVSVLGTVLNTF